MMNTITTGLQYYGGIYYNTRESIVSSTTSTTGIRFHVDEGSTAVNNNFRYQKENPPKNVDKENKNRLSRLGRSSYGPQKLTRKI